MRKPEVLRKQSPKSTSLDGLAEQLANGHRGLLSLVGGYDWAMKTVRQLWRFYDYDKTVALIDYSTDLGLSVKASAAYQYLGQEFDALFVDLSGPLRPDALAILTGCIRGGGLICLYWGECFEDMPTETHLCVEGWPDDKVGHRLRARVAASVQRQPHYVLREDDTVDFSMLISHQAPSSSSDAWTSDQKAAHALILKVATGRRRRPLVLEAPRGRGKSTILGQAVVDLLGHRSVHIQVVMPHAHSALPLLRLVESFMGRPMVLGRRIHVAEDRSITILTMEQLWDNDTPADVVFVDEAATFPVYLLSRLLSKTSRIVFSTTTAGYEGTGQGFRLRFDPMLRDKYPDRRFVSLQTPVRWASEDPVETWCSDVFCLDSTSKRCLENNHPVVVESEDRDALSSNPSRLEAVFSLLVRAHHRTAPSDLQRLLDAPNVKLWTATVGGHLVGVCMISEEGGLSPDMSQAVFEGKRRPRGHLLPETLISHAGMKLAGALKCWRVVRIAVDEQFRRRGVGTVLLARIQRDALSAGIDFMGASFGATESLLLFWRRVGYRVVRLGIKRGRSSGLHSTVVLRALSVDSQSMVSQVRQRYLRYFPQCLDDGFRHLEWSVTRGLFYDREPQKPGDICPMDLEDLRGFLKEHRSYEMVSPAIHRVLSSVLSGPKETLRHDSDWKFVIRKVFQHMSWQKMDFEGKVGGSRGLGQTQLRLSITTLLREEGMHEL